MIEHWLKVGMIAMLACVFILRGRRSVAAMSFSAMASTVTVTATRGSRVGSHGSGLCRHRTCGSVATEKAMKTAFLFPGQGSQVRIIVDSIEVV